MAGCPTRTSKELLFDVYDRIKTSAYKEEEMKLRILSLLFLSSLLINTASAQYQRTDLVSNQPGVPQL